MRSTHRKTLISSPTLQHRRSSQVVFRLRATFATVLLLLLLGLVLGAHELTRLQRSQSRAIDRSVPALVRSQALEGQLSTFLRYNDQLRRATTRASAAELLESIRGHVEVMRNTLQRLSIVDGHSSDIDSVARELATLDVQVGALALAKRQLILGDRSFAEQRSALERIGNAFRGQVIDATSALETQLRRMGDGEPATREEYTLLQLIERQNRLTELSFLVASVIDTADRLLSQASTGSSDESEVDVIRMTFELRSIVQALVVLEADESRVALAQLIRELRDRVNGADGTVTMYREHVRSLKVFGSIREAQSQIIARVSSGIDAVVERAGRDIADSTSVFDRVLLRTHALFLLIGFAILVVTGLTNWFVVERQINRRVSRLTTAILGLAAGNVDERVDISGDDEIASMADALETFRANARELRRSNRDLEQFAYAAAHDMRTPLRAIEQLAEWTLEDHEDLPEGCTDNLTKILQRAKRLSNLQNGLLDYSRAGHGPATVETVKPAELVARQAELVDAGQRFPITVTGQLEPLATYAVPLEQVLLNLLSNAIKHHDRDTGTLHVEVRQSADRVTFSVTDDGQGIAPEYQQQIFELFKMLQSQEVTEGSGLGLSLVRKLVDRYGGTIEVVSDPATARGTTFVFDWPRFEVSTVPPASG